MDGSQGAVVLMRDRDLFENGGDLKPGWLFRLEAVFVGILVIFGMLTAFGGLLWP